VSAVGGGGGPQATTTGKTPQAALVFSAHAHDYTEKRRRLVPGFDQFYGSAVEALTMLGASPPLKLLDIGAGTGLMSEAVAGRHPQARFDLLDGSEPMLAEVPAGLKAVVDTLIVADMVTGIPDGPYDAVISALAIHHLADADKRTLFARVHEVLKPGGVFVNAEQVSGRTAGLTAAYERWWEQQCRKLAAGEDEIAAAQQRKLHDRCSDVGSQLQWLREAGFETVDCLWKSWCFATIAAVKKGAL
jgi:tRNA (cmo5U34)-methyltransferase